MFIVIGIIFFALGLGLLIGRVSQMSKLMQIKATETSKVKELAELASQVAAEMGAGSFNQFVEIKGRCECENPLTSELAKVKCVYYSMRVSREYEETYWQTDSNGNRYQQTRTGSDTVASNVRSVPFYLNDGSGRIKVKPDSAQFIADKVFSQFQSGEVSGPQLNLGSLVFNLAGFRPTVGTRTLGYRYEEDAIQVGSELFVLGEAVDAGGELAVQKPADKKKNFIISVKGEEELIRSSSNTITGMLIAGIICLVIGGAIALLAIFNII